MYKKGDTVIMTSDKDIKSLHRGDILYIISDGPIYRNYRQEDVYIVSKERDDMQLSYAISEVYLKNVPSTLSNKMKYNGFGCGDLVEVSGGIFHSTSTGLIVERLELWLDTIMYRVITEDGKEIVLDAKFLKKIL